jgi:tRNA(adenine34) deaminase
LEFNFSQKDIFFMRKAIELAQLSAEKGDIPVGAIVVKDDKIIGEGHNTKFLTGEPLNHAEIIALKNARKSIGDWRLNEAVLYSTAEPCIMCAGAILHYRISKIIFGVREPKFGGIISKANLFDIDSLNHKVEYKYGLFEEEISKIMKEFFKNLRKERA